MKLYWVFDTRGKVILGVIEKLRKATVSFAMCVCLSVRQHGKTRLLLDGFL